MTPGTWGSPIRQLLDRHGSTLLKVASASIRHGFAHHQPVPVNLDDYPEPLAQIGASFVTLRQAGDLRGCIGSLDACRPLIEDVAVNSYAAAFRDNRFAPLRAHEQPTLDVQVSVLGAAEVIDFEGEEDLQSKLRPGVDGVILRAGGRRAVFLPQVWEQLGDPRIFLHHLKEKAGLPAEYWSTDCRAWRFVTDCVSSADIVPGPARGGGLW